MESIKIAGTVVVRLFFIFPPPCRPVNNFADVAELSEQAIFTQLRFELHARMSGDHMVAPTWFRLGFFVGKNFNRIAML